MMSYITLKPKDEMHVAWTLPELSAQVPYQLQLIFYKCGLGPFLFDGCISFDVREKSYRLPSRLKYNERVKKVDRHL